MADNAWIIVHGLSPNQQVEPILVAEQDLSQVYTWAPPTPDDYRFKELRLVTALRLVDGTTLYVQETRDALEQALKAKPV